MKKRLLFIISLILQCSLISTPVFTAFADNTISDEVSSDISDDTSSDENDSDQSEDNSDDSNEQDSDSDNSSDDNDDSETSDTDTSSDENDSKQSEDNSNDSNEQDSEFDNPSDENDNLEMSDTDTSSNENDSDQSEGNVSSSDFDETDTSDNEETSDDTTDTDLSKEDNIEESDPDTLDNNEEISDETKNTEQPNEEETKSELEEDISDKILEEEQNKEQEQTLNTSLETLLEPNELELNTLELDSQLLLETSLLQRQIQNDDPDALIKDWNVSKSDDNYTFTVTIRHYNQWDYEATNTYNSFSIEYNDTNGNGRNDKIQITYAGEDIRDGWYGSISGASISKDVDQKDTLTLTITIPKSFFASDDFNVVYADETLTPEIGDISIDEPIPAEEPFEQIEINGRFIDWENQEMHELLESDGENYVSDVAMVIQDGYLMIYIQGDGNGSETNSGTHHNGKYSITTDNGRTMFIQLNRDGTVSGGSDSMLYSHSGSQWEVGIPLSDLPSYNEVISFGLYQLEPSLSVVDSDHETEPTNIAYDGDYSDWTNYPHTLIQYATAGTQEDVPDGEGAMYMDDYIYGHCETRMPQHLNERGGEYTQAVTVSVNNPISSSTWDSRALQMRLATVDSNGNINWNPQKTNLSNGAYEYYIFAIDAWGSSPNINNLVEKDVLYGKAMITIKDDIQEMEWYIDPALLAERYNMSPEDIDVVYSQYGRIGQQNIQTGGASSGPLGTVIIALGCLLFPVYKKKDYFRKVTLC